jgi:hypothetical protein
MKSLFRVLAILALVVGVVAPMTGCDEDAGDELEDAAEEVEDEVD